MNAMIRVGLAAALLAVGGNAAGVTGQQAGAAAGDVDTTEGLEAPAADPSAPGRY